MRYQVKCFHSAKHSRVSMLRSRFTTIRNTSTRGINVRGGVSRLISTPYQVLRRNSGSTRFQHCPRKTWAQLSTDRSDRSDRSRSTVDHLDASLPLWDDVQDLYIVQIQPRKRALDHAGYTAPTWQYELHHTDQESICPGRSRSWTVVGIDYTDHTDHTDHRDRTDHLSEVCNFQDA